MAVLVSSDWHCQPDALKEEVVEWIRFGKENNHRLICAGDLFDILPLGKDKWQEAPSIAQLAEVLDGYHLYYVTGNHDPFNTMEKLMSPYPNIHMYKELSLPDEFTKDAELGKRSYLITHGHKWSLDWGYLGLRRIAPWIVEKMVDIAPGLWYRICRWQGWLASEEPLQIPQYKEQQPITRLTRIIWAGASDHAIKKNVCVILGHTHTTGRRERGISKDKPVQCYMADDGNIDDGSYVEITDDARIRWLYEND